MIQKGHVGKKEPSVVFLFQGDYGLVSIWLFIRYLGLLHGSNSSATFKEVSDLCHSGSKGLEGSMVGFDSDLDVTYPELFRFDWEFQAFVKAIHSK